MTAAKTTFLARQCWFIFRYSVKYRLLNFVLKGSNGFLRIGESINLKSKSRYGDIV